MPARGKVWFDHWVGSLVLIVISSIIALALAEYIFRAVKEMQWRNSAESWQHDLYAMLPEFPDSPLEYNLHPGVSRENRIPGTEKTWRYRINADGFRGENFDSGDNRKRVLFSGDSYTFGWAVNEDEVLTEAVERVLVEPPYKLEVDAYNLGVPGYNTVQEYHLLNQVVDRYVPDLVVLGYVMNDGEPQKNVPQQPSFRYKYVTSWLLSYVKEQINFYVYDGDPVLNTGMNIATDYLLAAKENSPKWAEGRQAFADMVALCNSRKIPFMVVIYPDYTQTFDEGYPYRMIHEEVFTWADEQGVRALDILPYMENKDHKDYWVEGDGHPNGRAFAEVAQILSPIIYEYFEGSTP